MTTILPPERSSFDVIMNQLGQSLGQNLPRIIERRQGMEAIDQLQSDLQNAGGDMTKVLPAIARAISRNPSLERSGLPQYALEVAKAKASQNAPIAGEQPRNREPVEAMQQRQQLPGFLGQQPEQTGQFFPTNVGPQGGPGNVPQAATTGVKVPLLTRAEKIPAAKQLAKERTDAGIPTTPQQAMEEINAAEEDKKEHNRLVDEELKQRVQGQQTYGKRGMEQLQKSYPQATSEMETIFQKYGEDAAAKGKSEADINRFLVKKADNFSDTIANIRKDMSAPRSFNAIQRGLRGTYKDFEQSANDLRVKMKPLLDEGLYDTSRNLLQELGYGPEEREVIIHPLSETSKIMMNKVPQGHALKWTPEKQKENVKNGLRNLKKEDPNFSLVLARKAMEDKNYDWRIYGDSLNDLIQNENFELTDDQRRQKTHLDTPPLEFLEKILHGIGIQGR